MHVEMHTAHIQKLGLKMSGQDFCKVVMLALYSHHPHPCPQHGPSASTVLFMNNRKASSHSIAVYSELLMNT